MNGIRKCLAQEFSSIHILNLRGDIRKNMLSKGRAREGENIFGSGSMTGIAVTILVKNPATTEHGKIYYHNIGDDLSVSEKTKRVSAFGNTTGISKKNAWETVSPDLHGDWLNQRDDSFQNHFPLFR